MKVQTRGRTQGDDTQAARNGGRGLRVVFILWLSLLAFALPEVFAGSSPNWPLVPFVYLFTIPLYALHFLLLCHLAVRTGRTSWPALYLFGVLFGLYESWITKVVWAGYTGVGGFLAGGIGPWFGAHETIGMVLFYHPVTSFLLPLAVVSRLFPRFGAAFPAPDWLFGQSRFARATRIGLALVWGIVSGFNLGDLGSFLVTWLPTLGLLWGGYRFLHGRGVTGCDCDVARPVMGRRGVWFAALALAVLYLVSYGQFLPEHLPPVPVQLVTLALYAIPLLGIWRSVPVLRRPPCEARITGAKAPARFVLSVFAVGLLTNLLGGFGVTGLAFMVALMAMLPLGIVLFAGLGVRGVVRDRRAGAGG